MCMCIDYVILTLNIEYASKKQSTVTYSVNIHVTLFKFMESLL